MSVSCDEIPGRRPFQFRFTFWCAGAPSTVSRMGGAPKSARLLGRPPTEWLQVMSRQDTLHAALQLQRDASLMSSNLTVLHQYAIILHRTATDMLHSVFGRPCQRILYPDLLSFSAYALVNTRITRTTVFTTNLL